MPNEIQMITKFYSAKGGAFLGSEQNSITIDMAGTHMASGTQEIPFGANNAELLDVPGDVTGIRWVWIKNLESIPGNFVQVGSASGAGFAATVQHRIPAGTAIQFCQESAVAIYLLADTAAVNVQWKVCQV